LAVSGDNGAVLWSAGNTVSSPSIGPNGAAGSLVLCLSNGNNANAIAAVDLSTQNAIWQNPNVSSYVSPAIGSDGTVYVAAGGIIAALNGLSGNAKWTTTLPDPRVNYLTIAADGTIYGAGSSLFAIDPTTGGIVFSLNLRISPSWWGPVPIAADGTLYVGDNDGNLVAVR
jgi:outer membrane protein assembly factor BamB